VQHGAKQRKETSLGMGDLQAHASPCGARIIIRNEQKSGSSPLVSALEVGLLKLKTREEAKPGDEPTAFLRLCNVID
jgi:hypothetical protein